MPFRKERYPADWKQISLRIREREGQRCKTCKAPNGEWVLRSDCGTLYMLPEGQTHRADNGEYVGRFRPYEAPAWFEEKRPIKVVLTVAHLNHDTTDNRDENLAALCQRCHLNHDRHLHAANARKTRQAKKAVRELFE